MLIHRFRQVFGSFEFSLGRILVNQNELDLGYRITKGRVERPIANVRQHFASLWLSVGLNIGTRVGDYLYICLFHNDSNPSIHVDGQRCICNCFSPDCVAFGGGGVPELEPLVGFDQSAGTPRPVSHQDESIWDTSASVLGEASNPDDDGPSTDRAEQLKYRTRSLFPIPQGVQPRVLARIFTSTTTPGVALRQQIISNTWDNPASRAIKPRVQYAHLIEKIVNDPNDASAGLFEVVVPQEELSDRKRSDPAAQVCAGAQGSMHASTIAPSLVLCDSLPAGLFQIQRPSRLRKRRGGISSHGLVAICCYKSGLIHDFSLCHRID